MRGYNSMTGYNIVRYNADGTELTVSDTINGSDSLALSIGKRKLDNLTITDTVTKQVTSKLLSDEVRLAEWSDTDRNPAQNDWGDQ